MRFFLSFDSNQGQSDKQTEIQRQTDSDTRRHRVKDSFGKRGRDMADKVRVRVRVRQADRKRET